MSKIDYTAIPEGTLVSLRCFQTEKIVYGNLAKYNPALCNAVMRAVEWHDGDRTVEDLTKVQIFG